ncbi:PaaI family thioesterase [Vannielia litorea]|uniref:PaaI family thioesterase n=1 Tax=Vannielia litorea TaxID=1217970 RepID=UPI001BCFFACA|nr:PaaI family thioesterase [Vannielia litorea]MBS8226280.1 PaaI family thioesterase [Vannielia litorea]
MLPRDHAQAILDAQPFSQLVGAELEAFEPGRCVIAAPFREDLTQHMGIAHGGVIATLADMALTFVGGSVLGPVITSEFKINYLRPGTGQRLVARGSVVGHGRRQAVTRCDIFCIVDGEEKLCAAAQATIVKLEDQNPQ